MKRTNRRPRIKTTDRLFWILLSRIWSPWCTSLIIVKPKNVVKWHRNGFKLFCEFKSKPKGVGRTHIHSEICDLVRKMATANPNWGAPRIHGELLRLGLEVPERTVSNLMPRRHQMQDFPNHGDPFLRTMIINARWTFSLFLQLSQRFYSSW